MTREEVYNACIDSIGRKRSLLIEAATGFGKSKLAIDLVNHLCDTVYKGRKVSMLLLVAKRVHKITWKEEIEKWGGLHVDSLTVECYESLRKHCGYAYNIIVKDECHHIGSEKRLHELSTIKSDYMIGLSATIPLTLKKYFRFTYHSNIVSCDITEAIEDEVLPEPRILLFPLELDNTRYTETWEVNPKAKGPVFNGTIRDIWKYKKNKQHALLSCTQRQWIIEMNKLIDWEKNLYMQRRSKALENIWLYHCGKRLEMLSKFKNGTVLCILDKLRNYRTITFCKTIEQAEILGRNCIHSKKANAIKIFDDFNSKKIKHITAVNILNENANLVDCKYAIFANLSSSEVIIPQRLGRAMRHKSPVIIVPFFKGTREEEIVNKMFEKYNKDFIRVINSIEEI